ncbi:MAG: hypothetical protein J7L89_01860 [Bacteroidales bacterium]|nr:hypothetical protein [Bacteroidales bacterium]
MNHFFNLRFPQFHSRLYLTYIRIHNHNLSQLIEDAHQLVFKHTVVADAIGQTRYENPEHHTFGILFDIKGNTASSVQFFITDSTRNFFRGSLYFNTEPNKDSLAPVISFLRKDVSVLMESLEWLN